MIGTGGSTPRSNTHGPRSANQKAWSEAHFGPLSALFGRRAISDSPPRSAPASRCPPRRGEPPPEAPRPVPRTPFACPPPWPPTHETRTRARAGPRPSGRPRRRTPTPGGTGTPDAAEVSAAATARSQAGSSRRTPPAVAPYRSLRPSGTPAASSTAAMSWNRRGSSPLTWRRGGPSVGTTSAWTSTASARRPASGKRDGRPRLAGAGQQQRRGVDLEQAGGGHLEPRDLALGPEPVLPAREPPQARPGIALERQDDVHRVLEGLRPGQIAVLRHVTRHDDRDALRPSRTPTSASAHERTCDGPPGTCPPSGSRSDWIESTASRNGRALARRLEHDRQLPARDERDAPTPRSRGGERAPTPGPATPRRRRAGRGARQPTGSPPTGGEGSTCRCRAPLRAGRRSPGRCPLRGRGRRRSTRSRRGARPPRGGEDRSTRAAPCTADGRDRCPLADRSPGPASGAAARPLRELLPAPAAGMDRPHLAHRPTVPAGCDTTARHEARCVGGHGYRRHRADRGRVAGCR